MASTFRLKRKTFSDEKSSGWGKKLAIGAAGTLAATAGAFYGAKKGMFGNNAQLWANRKVMQVGRSFGKDSNFGQKIVNSGKEGVNQAIKGIRESRAAEVIKKNLPPTV